MRRLTEKQLHAVVSVAVKVGGERYVRNAFVGRDFSREVANDYLVDELFTRLRRTAFYALHMNWQRPERMENAPAEIELPLPDSDDPIRLDWGIDCLAEPIGATAPHVCALTKGHAGDHKFVPRWFCDVRYPAGDPAKNGPTSDDGADPVLVALDALEPQESATFL